MNRTLSDFEIFGLVVLVAQFGQVVAHLLHSGIKHSSVISPFEQVILLCCRWNKQYKIYGSS